MASVCVEAIPEADVSTLLICLGCLCGVRLADVASEKSL